MPNPKWVISTFILVIVSLFFLFQAKETCPGGLPLTDGKCPELSCTGPSSCSYNGNCNSDSSECECDAGFSGSDCSFDLKGEKKKC